MDTQYQCIRKLASPCSYHDIVILQRDEFRPDGLAFLLIFKQELEAYHQLTVVEKNQQTLERILVCEVKRAS